jgi:hypothetical protein
MTANLIGLLQTLIFENGFNRRFFRQTKPDAGFSAVAGRLMHCLNKLAFWVVIGVQ